MPFGAGGEFPGGGGGGGSGGTVSDITSTGGTVTVTDPNGPTTNLEVAEPAAMVLIAKSVLVSPAANFTFSAIPATFNHLTLKLMARSSKAATDDNVTLQFNTDSGTHYTRNLIDITDASAVEKTDATQTSLNTYGDNLGVITAASASAGAPGFLEYEILSYANTTFWKTVRWIGGWNDTTVGSTMLEVAGGVWQSTAAINEIVLALLSGSNFIIGSAAYLYGIM